MKDLLAFVVVCFSALGCEKDVQSPVVPIRNDSINNPTSIIPIAKRLSGLYVVTESTYPLSTGIQTAKTFIFYGELKSISDSVFTLFQTSRNPISWWTTDLSYRVSSVYKDSLIHPQNYLARG